MSAELKVAVGMDVACADVGKPVDLTPRALEHVEASARDVAERTRALIGNHMIDADPATPSELAHGLADRCEEIRGLLTGPVGGRAVHAAELCELLTELTELQQDLREYLMRQRFDALARIHNGLARLRSLNTVEELLEAAPEELCHCCDFDRALVSRVRGSTWIPQVWCSGVGQDEATLRRTEAWLRDAKIPLTPLLLETELARRGSPALVVNPATDDRVTKELVEISGTEAYVAAPLMPTGRVIGFLHADCFGSKRALTNFDRDNLWAFGEGFGLIFERMILMQRLSEQQTQVHAAFARAEAHTMALCDSEVMLTRNLSEADAVSKPTSIMMPRESRIDTLLTARERSVLALMVGGARNIEIAGQLVISEGTVKSHVKNICRKLHAANRAEAVSRYLRLVMREGKRP